MLQAIRDKAHGIFAWVMLLFVGVPFGLWGINNYFDGGQEKPVAVVGDRDIFERDVNRAYENLVARMGSSDYDEKQLRHEALEQVINLELITQAARNEGLAISDAEIRGYVQSQPYFQSDGKFDKERLKSVVASQGMTPQQFSSQVAGQLLNEQFVRGITDTAIVTKLQLDNFYRFRNQERQIEYFTIPLKKADGEILDKDIEAYYQANKSLFQNPEMVSVEYISLSIDDVSGDFQPTEEELKTLYEEQKAQYGTPEQRNVSHILIAADMDKEDNAKAALGKAEGLRQRLSKGEDFSKLAKENSDDKVSSEKGGDLGVVTKETMDPNLAAAAFVLAKGEISQPVKTPFGFHLIKVTELVPANTKKFEEVRAELDKSFRRNAAENKFYEAKQKLDEMSFEHNDGLEPLAKNLNLKIAKTGLFTRDTGVGVTTEASLRNAAFAQDVLEGKNSPALEVGSDKVYVFHLKEHQPASDKPLADVKAEIVAKLRDKMARDGVREQAEQLLADVRQGKPLVDAAKSIGVGENKSTVKLSGKTDLPPALIKAVNKFPRPRGGKSSPSSAVMENGEQVVFILTEVKDGSAASVDAKELEMAKDYLSKNAGQAEFNAFLDYLRDKVGVKVTEQSKQ
ncbi:MAG: SurA N-terminal domain-containing protein [Candidatus Methylumidiphilus sp.]